MREGDVVPAPDTMTTRRTGASAPSEREQGTRVGRYVLLRTLGRGAMGVVYLAYDPELDRRLAVKVMSAGGSRAATARMTREAQALARLSDPHVVAVHDVGATGDGSLFIAMELIEGQTLRQWLASSRRVPEILAVFAQAAAGLAAAHDAGIVHRDFKPANVLVAADGRVRVVDFGLARRADADAAAHTAVLGADEDDIETADDGDTCASTAESASGDTPAPGGVLSTPLTRAGSLLGTPAYMSPEQLRGAGASPASDQYSFCIALHEALYGTRPFRGGLAQRLEAMTAGTPELAGAGAAGKVPARVRQVLARGLAARLESRFASMHEVRAQLLRAPDRRRRLVMTSAVALALGVAITAAAIPGAATAQCAVDETDLRSVWNGEVQARVQDAYAAAGAADTGARAVALLDGYAGDWLAQQSAACHDAVVRKVQSESDRALRVDCLHARRRQLGALALEMTRMPGPQLVERGLIAIRSLPAIDACAEVDELRARAPAPLADPDLEVRRETLHAALDEIEPLLELGRADDASQRLAALADELEAVSAPDARARWAFLDARAQPGGGLAGRPGDEERWQRVLDDAASSGDGHMQLRSLLYLAHIAGIVRVRFEEAEVYLRWAEIELEKLGRPTDLELNFLRARANIRRRQSRLDDARADAQRALALARETYGHEAPQLGPILVLLSDLALFRGDYEASYPYLERAIALSTADAGPAAPATFFLRLRHAGGHPQTPEGLRAQRADLDRLLDEIRAALGEDHDLYRNTIKRIADTERIAGYDDEAVAQYRSLLDLLDEPTREPDAHISALRRISQVERRRQRYDVACDYAARALRVAEDAYPPTDARLGESMLDLAICQVQSGQPDAALAQGERCLRLFSSRATRFDWNRAHCELVVARALMRLGRDRERTIRLAHQAYATFAADPAENAPKARETVIAELRAFRLPLPPGAADDAEPASPR